MKYNFYKSQKIGNYKRLCFWYNNRKAGKKSNTKKIIEEHGFYAQLVKNKKEGQVIQKCKNYRNNGNYPSVTEFYETFLNFIKKIELQFLYASLYFRKQLSDSENKPFEKIQSYIIKNSAEQNKHL